MIKIAIVRKVKGKYKLYSKHKGKDGKRKLLGTYDTLKDLKKREQQIHFFKSHADDGKSDDKETKILLDLSGIAEYLEESGFVEDADKIYKVMNLIDGDTEDFIVDQNTIPDDQLNIENQGFIGGDGTGGSYSLLSAPYGQPADDQSLDDDEVINILEQMPKKTPLSKRQKQNEDAVARSNGLVGNTSIETGMFSGLSDSYFYRGTGSIEDNL